MPKIVPPGFADVTLIWTQTGDNEPFFSTFGVELAAGVTDPVAVANNVNGIWQSAWTPASMSNQGVFVGTRVTLGSDGPDPGATGESLVNVAGTSSSAHLPSNCAALSRKITSLGGRRNRGRMFLPSLYLNEGNVDQNGIIAGAALTSMRTQQDAFLTGLQGSALIDNMVIFHSAAPATPTPVIDVTIEQKIATQRRRMRR